MACKPKECGCFGVKNLEHFNLSLLGECVWRYLLGNEAIRVKVLESKYGDLSKNLEVDLKGKSCGRNLSSWWRDPIKWVGLRFKRCVYSVIGDGCFTSVGKDDWLGLDRDESKGAFPEVI